MVERKTFFLCGIGGSGMSAIAQVLVHQGHTVRGSDRSRDRGLNSVLYEGLAAHGMALFPQDGSGVDGAVDELVVSSAVEESNLDVKAALTQKVRIRKRAEVLADLFNRGGGVAVGGTSGKSTVTGMAGQILCFAGLNPTVINGGAMLNTIRPPLPGNAICGDPDLPVIEADESDGTISLYEPAVAVVTNISLDHKPLAELRVLFQDFVSKASRAAVLNLDCPESVQLSSDCCVTFAVENRKADFCAAELEPLIDGVRFQVNGTSFRLRTPGRHNVYNALAALAACSVLGVSVEAAAEALGGFLGIGRRLQVLGTVDGVTVIDDFGHNPDKIAASLSALKEQPGRLLVMFQPHGFGPTRFLKAGLISAFVEGLEPSDLLVMPEIFYAGGTATKDISSQDLIEPIAVSGLRAEYIPKRDAVVQRFVEEAEPGDRVVVMGARDDTLTDVVRQVLEGIGMRKRKRV